MPTLPIGTAQEPEVKIYSFLNDYVFKWIFGQPQHERFTICLLNALLSLEGRRKITEVTIMNPFNDKEFQTDKLSVVDVKVRDRNNGFYIVELQILPDKNYIKRSTYYLARLYGRQLRAAQGHNKIQPATAISILGFNLFKTSSRVQEIFTFKNQEGNLCLSKTMELHYLDLTKFSEKKPYMLRSRFEKWLHVIKFGELYGRMSAKLDEKLCREEGLEEMVKELQKINADTEKRQLMETREKTRTILNTIKSDAYARGLKRGETRGEKRGLDRGRLESKFEVAVKMHAAGMSNADISKLTGLPEEDLQKHFNNS